MQDVNMNVYFLKKMIRAYWSKRRVETNGSFQNHPNSLEIVITWCYRKPFHNMNVLYSLTVCEYNGDVYMDEDIYDEDGCSYW